MIKLKQAPPSYICCANIALAYLVASLLTKKRVRKRDATLRAESILDRTDGWITLYVNPGTVTLYSIGTRETGSNVVYIERAADIPVILGEPVKPRIMMGEYQVHTDRRPDGIEVAGHFVPWQTVRDIAALDPTKR